MLKIQTNTKNMEYQIEQILSVKQVCKILNCHISTIYRWEAEGNLPFTKIRISRGKVGFRKSDVMDFINSQVEETSNGIA